MEVQRIIPSQFALPTQPVQWLDACKKRSCMSPGMWPAGIQPPDMAEDGAIKSWLDALASGGCDAPAFLRAMQTKFSADPDGTWEVLSQLDQYYRRGRIETETFKSIKTALAESVLGLGPIPGATDSSTMRAAPPPRDAPVARDAPPMARDAPAARDVPAARDPLEARDVPVARDVVTPARTEQTDAHPRREETQSLDSMGDIRPGSVLRRRYRIENVVGHGGMGTVFQVLDEFRLEAPGSQRLAVKILYPAVAKRAELLAELRREFQSLQMLSHPNIIRVFDFDRDGPLLFFTMELLTGAPLSRLLQARKLIPLERPQAFALIREAGAALAYAHSRGVVHGDLNLRNIFVTGSGELRVMSFGASHRARQNSQAPDHELTLPFSASNYASCQVLEGERADARDDVFSLACIAYLLLSGSHPFPKSTAIEARASRLRIRRPANLGGRQWQALRSALRWERENRPADVQQWLKELELGGAPKRLAPLNDLLEPPAAKEPLPWRALGIAAGVALLLFAAYWVVSHRAMLPSLDSTASIRAPVSPAPSADNAGPPVSVTPSTTSPPVRVAPTTTSPPVSVTPRTTSPPPLDRAKPPAAVPRTAPISQPTSREARVAAATPPPRAASPAAAPPAAPAASPAAAPAAKAPAGASKIELAADTVEVPTGEASAELTVQRKGSLRGETSFTWWTESGTAKPGADFSAVMPKLAYVTDGKSSVTLSVPVSNARHAQAKSFYVVIDHSEGGATLGTRTLTMVTLLPND
jgi:serine/threonine protein kinase